SFALLAILCNTAVATITVVVVSNPEGSFHETSISYLAQIIQMLLGEVDTFLMTGCRTKGKTGILPTYVLTDKSDNQQTNMNPM
ncbi:hypothetical protein L9F63_025361, partial [Diploptera punctata]